MTAIRWSRRGFCLRAVLAALLAVAAAGESRGAEVDRVVVIFVDVSSSLSRDELAKAADLAGQVLAQLGKADQFYVYPIHHDPERAEPLGYGRLPRRSRSEQVLAFRAGLKQLAVSLLPRLQEIYKRYNSDDGAPDDRSCILNSLYVVRQVIERTPDAEVQVVYLSDMVEECATSPLGESFDLDRKDIGGAIERAREVAPEKVDCEPDLLAGSSVHVAMPTTATSALVGQRRPEVRDLRRFWEAALQNCGLAVSDASDPSRFQFSTVLPDLRRSTRAR